MEGIISSPLFGIVLSLFVYLSVAKLRDRLKSDLLNPLLWASIIIIAFLMVTKIPYDSYNIGGKFIASLIGPATVALAIPLYKNLDLVKKHSRLLLISILSGVLAHALVLVALILILKLDLQMSATLLPKSVTIAIAKDIADGLGGMTTITISTVIITGIVGAVLAPYLNKLFKLDDPMAQGLALGTAAHAVGTSKAVEMGELQGTMSSLALIITGLMTVVVSPITHAIVKMIIGF